MGKEKKFSKNILHFLFVCIGEGKIFHLPLISFDWSNTRQISKRKTNLIVYIYGGPIPDHLTCLLRNLSAGQEAIVRAGHGTTDWFQIGKAVHQGCILSPCLYNVHAEYIMKNAGLEEEQVGIKIARRNINNLRYADDTTLMAESEEELKSLLMKMKEESEKVGLKLNIQKSKIMASGPIISWQIDGETVETVAVSPSIYFIGLQNHCRW